MTDQDKSNVLKIKIQKIKQRLLALDGFHPGSITKQYSKCGSKGCKCRNLQNPQLHGPYYQLSFNLGKGKHTTAFIKNEYLPTIQKELSNYKLFKKLIEEWVTIEINLSKMKRESSKQS